MVSLLWAENRAIFFCEGKTKTYMSRTEGWDGERSLLQQQSTILKTFSEIQVNMIILLPICIRYMKMMHHIENIIFENIYLLLWSILTFKYLHTNTLHICTSYISRACTYVKNNWIQNFSYVLFYPFQFKMSLFVR